ncbi:hypothetical protein AMECASPLE_017784 [Ameca splendens]|uniref:Uncharacterized protein n=1 Tax=Ameca splendens TaxID=208324 RepID=A0ABV0Y302_9TELE
MGGSEGEAVWEYKCSWSLETQSLCGDIDWFNMLLSVLLLLLLVSGTQTSHYRGTLMTYYPQETYANGSVSVILRFKFNSQPCLDTSFSCTGNCGNESLVLPNTKCEEVIDAWCQSEKITSRMLSNNSPFQLVYASGVWLPNVNGIGSWRAVSDVELRHRSDTNKPNSSPQTTMFPVLRLFCYHALDHMLAIIF